LTQCPVCQQPLGKRQSEYGVFWACDSCANWLIALSTLRRTVEPSFFSRLWQDARAQEKAQGGPCPICRKAMTQVFQPAPRPPAEARSLAVPDPEQGPAQPASGDPLVFQFCKGCLQCWLGPLERAALPLQAQPETVKPPEPKKDDISQEARELLALHKVELIAERAKQENAFDASHLPLWQKYLAAFGFPVQDGGISLERTPWITILMVVLTTAVSVFFFTDFIRSVETFGFIPVEFDRMGGLTFLSCFFVHGGWMHLLGNMYFLLVFGRGVEDRIGKLAFLGVLAISTVGGGILTILMDPQGDIPHVGASGGISGILLLFTLFFPRSQLAFMFSAHVARPQLIRLPAWAMLAFWVASQLVGLSFQSSGAVSVSYSGHVGGLLGGLAFWLGWKWVRSGGLIKVKG